MIMGKPNERITVYYDGACPACVRDRQRYEQLAGEHADEVCWFDITDQDETLEKLGIAPELALTELHVKDADEQVHRELDAYILLMQRAPKLRPLAWLLGLPLVRPILSRLYRAMVRRRLRREGRL